jgi:hypothetical protein
MLKLIAVGLLSVLGTTFVTTSVTALLGFGLVGGILISGIVGLGVAFGAIIPVLQYAAAGLSVSEIGNFVGGDSSKVS